MSSSSTTTTTSKKSSNGNNNQSRRGSRADSACDVGGKVGSEGLPSTLSGEGLSRSADAFLIASSNALGEIGSSGGSPSGRGGESPRSTAAAAAAAMTRRMLFASSLIAAGAGLAGGAADAAPGGGGMMLSSESKLQWEVTPVNKRTGVTVFDAEKSGYNVRFVTYLSRFLLAFDQDCQRWWYARAADIPRTASAEQVNEYRLRQFGAFSASVEVGLQEYRDESSVLGDGPRALLTSLVKRYCPDVAELRKIREESGLPPLSEQAQQRQEREVREARRQIALLFGLMEKNQPVEAITKLLAAIDNGSIASVRVLDRGGGYAPGYGPPNVEFPPPEAGEKYVKAAGRAVLTPNGRILRVDVVNRGSGYTKAPAVTVAPPASIRFADDVNFNFGPEELKPKQAEAKAFLFRSGPNKGRIERIQVSCMRAVRAVSLLKREKLHRGNLLPADLRFER